MAFSSTYAIRTARNEFAANSYTDGDQSFKQVLALPGDGFVVAYDSLLNFYETSGAPTDAFVSAGGIVQSLAAFDNGDVLALCTNDSLGLYARRFDADGRQIGQDIDLVDREVVETFPTSSVPMTTFADGSFAFVYYKDASIQFDLYNASGVQVAHEQVDTLAEGTTSMDPAVTRLADGGFIVTYTDFPDGGVIPDDNQDVRAGIFNADGSVRREDFFLLGEGEGSGFSDGSVVALSGGGFALAYTDWSYGRTGNPAVVLRLYDENGNFVKHALVAGLAGTHAREIEPDIAVLENGFIAVSWTQGQRTADHLDAYVRIFDETGTALPGAAARYSLGSVDDDHSYFRQADIAATLGGRLVAAWRDTDVDGSGDGVSTVVKNLVRRSVGTEGSDSFLGDELDDEVHAGGGADLVAGAGGLDQLYGEAGNDFLSGNEGGDYLYGGHGADVADGGADNDFISGETGADTLAGGDGEDRVYGGEDADRLSGGAGDDTLSGGTGADALNGGDGRDQMFGGAGLDRLEGGTGDDAYFLTDITPTDVGTSGKAPPPGPGEPPAYVFDTVVEAEGAGFDSVYVQRATYGQATLASYTLGDNIERGVIQGTAAFDLTGNALANKLYGNAAANALKGLGSDDFLFGGGGGDRLEGGAGNDYLYGQAGVDTMIGGLGDDIYGVDAAQDLVTEVANGGIDTVVASLSWALGAELEKLTLSGAAVSGVGNELANTVTGHGGANRLFGMAGADILFGLGGQDSLNGGTGNDTLSGGAGLDTLVGGSGNDRIAGSTGADLISGQAGADRFVYLSTADSTYAAAGRDVIGDFARAEGDRIELTSIDANANLAGNQTFVYIGAREFSAAGQLRWKAFEGFSLLYGDVNGDKTPDFAIRVDEVTAFESGDFLL